MKKLLAIFLALTMILALTGCGAPAPSEPASEPESESAPEPEPSEPEPVLFTVEGVVKEVSSNKITLTLADGSNLVLDTAAIAGLDAQTGDRVKAEYTGAAGAAAAAKVEVTAKAEAIVVTGTVTEVTTNLIFMTLENGTEAALKTSVLEGREVGTGDTLIIKYNENEDDLTIISVEIIKSTADAPKPTETNISSSQASAPAVSSGGGAPSGVGGSSGGGSSSGAGGSSGSGGGSSSNAGSSFNDFLEEYRQWAMQHYEEEQKASSDSNGSWYDDDDDWDDDWDNDDDDIDVGSNKSNKDDKSNQSSKNNYDDLYDMNKNPFVVSPPSDEQADDAGDVYEAVRLINVERVKEGLPEVAIDPTLMEMAQARAEEEPASWGHTRPDGSNYWTIFDEYGYESHGSVENADRSRITASRAVNAWMHSAGHKANILNKNITKIGVGYCHDDNSDYKYYWIMLASYN